MKSSKIGFSLIICMAIVVLELFILHVVSFQSRAAETFFNSVLHRSFDITCIILVVFSVFFAVKNRYLHYFFFFCTTLFCVSMLTYLVQFGQPMSWLVLSNQFYEGWMGMNNDMSFVQPIVLAIGIFSLALKCVFYYKSKFFNGSRKFGITAFFLFSLLSFVGFFGVNTVGDIKTWRSVRDVGVAHGYVKTWLGEAIYLNQSALLSLSIQRRIENNRNTDLIGTFDSIQPDTIKNIVVIQVESLGWNAFEGLSKENRIPFMSSLAVGGELIKLKTIHDSGSSDADFTVIAGMEPVGGIAPYKINYGQYEGQFLPHKFPAGFETALLHGMDGTYFDRKKGLRNGGFDHLIFAEEFREDGLEDSTTFGFYDHVVLENSCDLIESDKPFFHFIITLTTHYPFAFYPDFSRQLQSDAVPSELDRYILSMNYFDDVLREYVECLPDGTWIHLYGDHEVHWSLKKHFNPSQAYIEDVENVPLITFFKSEKHKDRIGGNSAPEIDRKVMDAEYYNLIDYSYSLHELVEKKFRP